MAVEEMAIREICEKMDFTPSRGTGELVEEWESPNVLLETGTLKMEIDSGAVVVAQIVRRTEFVKYSLDISREEPYGKSG